MSRKFFAEKIFCNQLITADARTRGDLATEFFPLPQNEFRKKKRTIYRKASHEFQHLLVAGKKYVVFRSPIIGFSVQLFTPIFRQNFSNHHRKCPEQKCFPICQNCQPLTFGRYPKLRTWQPRFLHYRKRKQEKKANNLPKNSNFG